VFRRADGIWVGALSIGYHGTGKRRRRVVYGNTKTAVLEQLARLRADVSGGVLVDPRRLTVEAFLERWLEDTVRVAARAGTYVLYKGLVRHHILPQIGGVFLNRLTPAHVQEMLAVREKAGVSPRTRQLAYTVLHRALRQALQWGMISRNACDAVARPRVSRKSMRFLTPDQVKMLLDAARGTRFEPLYVLAVTTGMRQGELFGLQWDDVDLANATIHIHHSLQQIGGRLWLDEPKSPTARRIVNLPKMAVFALRAHRERMLAEGHPRGTVFRSTNGAMIRKSNFIRQSFRPLLRQAGLPLIRFHDLRHTAATLLLLQKVHPKVVQELLGHSHISITLDTYSHVLPSMGREAAAKIDHLFEAHTRGPSTVAKL
jgi:integrase